MMVFLTLLILGAPFAIAVVLGLAVRPVSAPKYYCEDDRDAFRIRHDLEAIRTRFERYPVGPH